MKRILSFLLATALCLCIFSLASCKKEGGDSTDPVSVDLDDTMYDAIKAWESVSAWDMAYTSMASMVDDGNTEEAQGYALSFDGKCIPAEKGNMYKGNYVGMNSGLAFELTYEYHYYDGWAYEAYIDPYGVSELNEYCRYQTPEEDFLVTMDGLNIPVVTREEFDKAQASKTEEGEIVVNVPVTDVKTMDALILGIDMVAASNDVDLDELTVSNALISYAIRDGKLYGYMGSYSITLDVDGVSRVYSIEKSATVNAVNDEVETFTLPEDAESYEILEFEE